MPDILYNVAPDWRTTYFDDQGVPLIDGSLTFYKASDHGTKKDVYTSNIITPPATTPPTYSNPIDLAAGANVGPIFFASDENYYIELKDSVGTLVDSVDNWNSPENTDPTPKVDEVDVENYIINADYSQILRRKFESTQLSAAVTKVANASWGFTRSNTNATLTLEFIDFLNGQTDVTDDPKAYIKYECTAVGAGGETEKALFHEINDVISFNGQDIIIVLWARSDTSSDIGITLRQQFGSGGSSEVSTTLDTITLSTTWTKYVISGTVPSISGKTIGNLEDDSLKIYFDYPLNQIAEIEITKAQLNRGDLELEFNYKPPRFTNQDVIGIAMPEPIITFPVAVKENTLFVSENGDTRWAPAIPPGIIVPYAAGIVPSGWLLCDGITKITTYFIELFNVLGTAYGREFTSSSVATNVVTVTGEQNGNVTDVDAGTSGFTVNVTQQGTAGLPEIFTIATTDATSITPGSYLTFTALNDAVSPIDFYIWFSIDNSGEDPALGGKIALKVNLKNYFTNNEVATEIKTITDPISFGIPDYRGYFLRGTDNGAGVDPDAASRTDRGDGTTGDAVGTKQADEYKSHTHSYNQSQYAAGKFTAGANPGTDSDSSIATGPAGGNETRPVNINVNYIIKY